MRKSIYGTVHLLFYLCYSKSVSITELLAKCCIDDDIVMRIQMLADETRLGYTLYCLFHESDRVCIAMYSILLIY